MDSTAIMLGAGKRLADKAKDYTLFKNKMSSRDTEMAIVESIAAGMGGDTKAAMAVYQALPPGAKETVRVSVLATAETDPEVAKGGLLRVGGEEWKGDTLERIGDITKDYQDKQEADLDSLELRLGFREKGLLFDADKFGLEDFKTKAKEQGVAKTTTMAALLSKGSNQQVNIAEAKKLFLKEGGKEKDWAKYQIETSKELAALDDDSKDFLKGASKRKMSELSDWVTGAQKQGATAAVRSEAFGGMFAEFSSGLAESYGTKKGAEGVSDIRSMLTKMTAEELTAMSKAGGRKGALGKLGLRARSGDQKALTALTQEAGRVGGEELTDTAVTAATGWEAKAAAKSADASGEMALVAQSFSPAVKDFAKAAKMLLDTAEIQRANNKQGRE
jgi:hypothetical protein